jgi:4,5-DOPA dioxygenase extradiol
MKTKLRITNAIGHGCLLYQPLIDFEKQSKAVQLAIPTPEHYLPLIYTLGLQQKGETISLFNDKLVAGSLSMTSLKIA